MKIQNIVNIYESVSNLLEKDMTIKQGFILTRIYNKCQPEYTLYMKKKDELVRKYGKEKDDGSYEVAGDQRVAFFTELAGLLDVKSEIVIDKIKMEDLEGISAEGKYFIALEPLVE